MSEVLSAVMLVTSSREQQLSRLLIVPAVIPSVKELLYSKCTGSHKVHVFFHLFFIHAVSRKQPTADAPGSRKGGNSNKLGITNKSLIQLEMQQNFQVSKSETETSAIVWEPVCN